MTSYADGMGGTDSPSELWGECTGHGWVCSRGPQRNVSLPPSSTKLKVCPPGMEVPRFYVKMGLMPVREFRQGSQKPQHFLVPAISASDLL